MGKEKKEGHGFCGGYKESKKVTKGKLNFPRGKFLEYTYLYRNDIVF